MMAKQPTDVKDISSGRCKASPPRTADEMRKRRVARLAVKYSIAVMVILVASILSPVVTAVVTSGLCLWGLLGPVQMIQALSLMVFVRFMNPALVTFDMNIGILPWILLMVAAVAYLPGGVKRASRSMLPIVVFCLIAAMLSAITSRALDISVLKIISFMVGSLTIISIYSRLTPLQVRSVVIWIFSLLSMIVALSLATFADKNVAYSLNGTGFQGILNHPQTFGALMAPFAAFFLARFAFGKGSLLTSDLFLSGMLMVLIILSETRTAAVAVVFSVTMTLYFVGLTTVRARIRSASGFWIKAIAGTTVLLAVILYYQPAQKMIMDYVFKRGAENVEEALSSRSRGFSSQLENFMANPILGHGFGVYPGPVPSKNVKYFHGIPVSAAVEKGFLPTAILEEVGIIGAVAFAYLLFSITKPVLRVANLEWISLYFGCLFVNVGEAVFFGVGGVGLFYWILIGLSMVIYRMEDGHA